MEDEEGCCTFFKAKKLQGEINLNLLVYLSLFVPNKKDKILSSWLYFQL